MASGTLRAIWLILPERSWKSFCRSSGLAARGVVAARVKITLSAPRLTLSIISPMSLSEQQPNTQTMLSYGTCAPTQRISAFMAAGLCAPSQRIRGRCETTSIRPGTLVAARPAVSLSSGSSKPKPFRTSAAASARPQLMAWCSPGIGTGTCSRRLVLV